MVELQVLNKLIESGSPSYLFDLGIQSEHFIVYKEEYDFIINHYREYSKMPDVVTLLDHYPDFDILQVEEADRYLADSLREQYIFSKLSGVLSTGADMAKENSIVAMNYFKKEIDSLCMKGNISTGVNIIETAMERWKDYDRRVNVEGLLGIPSGMPELDFFTHGWVEEDFVTITGRTNEGKSWVLLYYLVEAWKQGKKVLLYSGEMNEIMTGYRFDTLLKNYSNQALMRGEKSIKCNEEYISTALYNAYLKSLAKEKNPFIVVTPKHLAQNRLDMLNLHRLIEKEKPDIIGIDQISLMADYRSGRGDNRRMELVHISEDIFATTEKYRIPLLVDAQASRESSKNKKGEKDDTPELEHIGESDAIGQNSTRVIGIKQSGAGLKVGLKKNRYGLNNIGLVYYWDIDSGIFRYVPSTEDNVSTDNRESTAATFKDGTEVF